MSDKDKRTDKEQASAERSPQVGALLRASRLRVGEDLREISDILCIRYLYLEAIEECRYQDLPGDTYAVGFIRSYSEHLGLDGEEVVRRYRAEQTGARRANDLSFPTPVPDSGMPKGAIVFIGVLLAMLIYGGWYVTTTDESILSDLISPVPDSLKHLVTGDDAVDSGTGSAPADGQPAPEMNENGQLSGAADVAAERKASAAADAADTAAAAVTSTTDETASEPAPATDGAATPAATDSAAAPVTAETPAAPALEKPTPTETATAESAATVQQSAAAATESAATGTAAATETPGAATEAAPQPAAEEPKPAATAADTAQQIQETAAAATEAAADRTPAATETMVTSETLAPPPAATENVSEPAPAAEAQPQAEAPPQQPTENVTAEDLNAQALKRATAQSGVSVIGNGATTGEAAATATPTTAADSETVTETAALPQTTPAGPSSGIVIRANDSSWVEVTDPASGRVIYTGLLSPGATIDVPDTQGLLLDTGNAGALDITVDGVAVPKLGGIGAVRKGVRLDADRLKAGTAVSR